MIYMLNYNMKFFYLIGKVFQAKEILQILNNMTGVFLATKEKRQNQFCRSPPYLICNSDTNSSRVSRCSICWLHCSLSRQM